MTTVDLVSKAALLVITILVVGWTMYAINRAGRQQRTEPFSDRSNQPPLPA